MFVYICVIETLFRFYTAKIGYIDGSDRITTIDKTLYNIEKDIDKLLQILLDRGTDYFMPFDCLYICLEIWLKMKI